MNTGTEAFPLKASVLELIGLVDDSVSCALGREPLGQLPTRLPRVKDSELELGSGSIPVHFC